MLGHGLRSNGRGYDVTGHRGITIICKRGGSRNAVTIGTHEEL